MGAGLGRRAYLVAAASAVVAMLVAVLVGSWALRRATTVQVVDASGAATPACQKVSAQWPATVAGASRRATTGSTASVAFGDPAIVVRCGVPALAPTSDECVDVSGVSWVVHPLSDGSRLTTYGTDPAIELLVPSSYGSAPLVAADLGAVAHLLPTNGRTCQ